MTEPGRRSGGLTAIPPTDSYGRRPLVMALAMVGLGIGVYLLLVQLTVVGDLWEPLFGSGGEAVLRSPAARLGTLPDAAVVTGAYLLTLTLGRVALRPGRSTAAGLAFGSFGIALGIAGLISVAGQALVIHAWCTLCLVSAGVALSLAAVAGFELSMALGEASALSESSSHVEAGEEEPGAGAAGW